MQPKKSTGVISAMNKLELLKKYITVQAEDKDLWYKAKYCSQDYLQQELRRIAWLIEEAAIGQIKEEINKLKGRLP
jgi:hypothetical protein